MKTVAIDTKNNHSPTVATRVDVTLRDIKPRKTQNRLICYLPAMISNILNSRPFYLNRKALSSSLTPEISTLASQSRLCFPSSLVSSLVPAATLPLR